MFFAVEPSPALVRRLQAHAARWNWDAQARRSPPHKLHLTLVFVAAADPEQVQALLRLGARVAATHRGCRLVLDRASVWPQGGIAHLAPSAVPDALRALQQALHAGARAAGAHPDQRTWRPHLTLARRAQPGQAPREVAPLDWQVRSFSLQRSLPGAARYQTLGRWVLGGSGTGAVGTKGSSAKLCTVPSPPTAASAAQ